MWVSEGVCELLRKVYGVFYNVSIGLYCICNALHCDYNESDRRLTNGKEFHDS